MERVSQRLGFSRKSDSADAGGKRTKLGATEERCLLEEKKKKRKKRGGRENRSSAKSIERLNDLAKKSVEKRKNSPSLFLTPDHPEIQQTGAQMADEQVRPRQRAWERIADWKRAPGRGQSSPQRRRASSDASFSLSPSGPVSMFFSFISSLAHLSFPLSFFFLYFPITGSAALGGLLGIERARGAARGE